VKIRVKKVVAMAVEDFTSARVHDILKRAWKVLKALVLSIFHVDLQIETEKA